MRFAGWRGALWRWIPMDVEIDITALPAMVRKIPLDVYRMVDEVDPDVAQVS